MKHWHGKLLLQSLRLQNFRQFDDLDIKFDDRLTVLIGENGSGKTTVLEAAAKCMRLYAERMVRADSDIRVRDFFYTGDIKNTKNESHIAIKNLFLIEKNDESKPESNNKHNNEDRLMEYQAKLEYYLDDAEYLIFQAEKFFNESGDQIGLENQIAQIENDRDQRISALNQEYPDIAEIHSGELNWSISIERDINMEGKFSSLESVEYIGRSLQAARKATTDISQPFFKYYPCRDLDNTPNNAKQNLQSNYYGLAQEETLNLHGFTTWYRRMENQAKEKNDFLLVNQIQNAVYELLGDDETHQFSNLRVSYLNEEKPDGELWINKNDLPLKLDQLSSGENMLFLIVADMARRFVLANPKSAEPYKEGSAVVLIDEIDLHLHPAWQRSVIPKLLEIFPKVQFVVTTHSPFVLQNVPSESILVMKNGTISKQKYYALGRDISAVAFEIFGQEEFSTETEKSRELLRMAAKCFDLIEDEKLEEAESLYLALQKYWPPLDTRMVEIRTALNLALHSA